jgi:lipopolysaccharide/colanic/teichoic acid biosynthesis glycosyltransferase
MRTGAEKKGLLTVGASDPRITRAGLILRKFKLDELPQLANVLAGQMSLVGPRPEVRRYVDLYTPEQRRVLTVRPGITDFASVAYYDENALLAASSDPERTYIAEVMPAKIRLNMQYINDPSLRNYFRVLGLTLARIAGKTA